MNSKHLEIIPKIFDWAQRNQSMFFRSGIANTDELIFGVLLDIFHANGKVFIDKVDDWWLISSDVDWLTPASTPLLELFTHTVSEPSRSANSMRSEFLLGVFCSDICVYLHGEISQIKGYLFDFEKIINQSYFNNILVFKFTQNPVIR
jgi:hypothetical protein